MSRNLLLSFVCAAGTLVACAGEALSFTHRPQLAGKASLTSPGFEVTRTLGEVALAPELRLPIELVYDSSSESSGIFGFAWRSPQLESAVGWDRDGLLWTTPWGEQVKFFPKKGKAPKDAVKLAPIEAAKRGRGLFAPYSDWEADAASPDYAKARAFTLSGKNGLKGWRFAYSDGRLRRIETPQGGAAEFEYAKSGELLAVSSRGTRFVELAHGGDGLVSSLALNGVPVALAYAKAAATIGRRHAHRLHVHEVRSARGQVPRRQGKARGVGRVRVFEVRPDRRPYRERRPPDLRVRRPRPAPRGEGGRRGRRAVRLRQGGEHAP